MASTLGTAITTVEKSTLPEDEKQGVLHTLHEANTSVGVLAVDRKVYHYVVCSLAGC